MTSRVMTSSSSGPSPTRRSNGLWDVAPEDHPHDLVAEVGGGFEHAGASTIDHGDSVLMAVVGGGHRHAAGARATVHPHLFDAELVALAHGAFGVVGRGGDHDGVDASRDALQVVVAVSALDLIGIGVDREHLIP